MAAATSPNGKGYLVSMGAKLPLDIAVEQYGREKKIYPGGKTVIEYSLYLHLKCSRAGMVHRMMLEIVQYGEGRIAGGTYAYEDDMEAESDGYFCGEIYYTCQDDGWMDISDGAITVVRNGAYLEISGSLTAVPGEGIPGPAKKAEFRFAGEPAWIGPEDAANGRR